MTVYCDASFKDGRGTWAIWLRSKHGRVVRNGVCPPKVTCSMSAEFYAAYVGMWAAVRTWPDTTVVLVNSDCQTVTEGLYPQSPPIRNPVIRYAQDVARAFLQKEGLRVRTKWVKGHQRRSASVRAYLNSRCDALAAKAHREPRAATYIAPATPNAVPLPPLAEGDPLP